MKKDIVKKSKFLSLLLRHKPETIGLELDDNGWANVHELFQKWKSRRNETVTMEELEEVVDTNNKKRFEFNEDMTKIRARQGHSIDVDVELKKTLPPKYLYHGTAQRFLNTILKDGISKMNRNHVHLSTDWEIARTVGRRHGAPVVLEVLAEEMSKVGHEFFLSNNGVWLTDNVPIGYIGTVVYEK